MEHTGRFVAYYRVSTAKQGQSGLGLDAQKKTVEDFLNGGAWTLEQSFVEIESGRKAGSNPYLREALAYCRKHKATLVKVGEAMKISKERVRQIQESALDKLRQLLSMDPILH